MQQFHDVLKPLSEVYGTTFGLTISGLPSVPTDAVQAWLHVEGYDARAKFNATTDLTTGVTSAAGGGFILFVNDINTPYHIIEGYDLINRIRIVGGDATETTLSTINVLYLGHGAIS